MNANTLFWLLPISLILLVFSRGLLANKKSSLDDSFNIPTQKSKRKSRGWMMVFLTLCIIFIVVYIKNPALFGKPSISCPTRICPEEFADMTKMDINEISGIFDEKNFLFDETETDYFFGKSKISYFSEHLIKNNESEVIEFCFIERDSLREIGYVLKSKKKYEKFFKYLESIGGQEIYLEADSIIIDKRILGDYDKIYKYNDAIFIDYGYKRFVFGYLISIYRLSLFEKGIINKQPTIAP